MEQAGRRRPTPEQASWLHSFFGVDISKYADEAEAEVSQAGHAVAQGASAAVGVVEEKAGEAGHAIAHGAQVVKDEAVHVAHEAGEAIEEGIRKAVAFMKEVGGVVEELITELKQLVSFAKQDMHQCPGECVSITTTAVASIGTGISCVASAVAIETPLALPAVATFIASVLGFLTSLGGVAYNFAQLDKCLATAIETKKKEAETAKEHKEEEDHCKTIMEELKRLGSRQADAQVRSNRIHAHVQHLKALAHAAPRHDTKTGRT